MSKVYFSDKRVIEIFLKITSVISTAISMIVLFIDIPQDCKIIFGFIFISVLLVLYILIWKWADNLNHIDINVEGSEVTIKVGDIFLQPGFKVIPFNEYYDTKIDNHIISANSLNGIFLNQHLDISIVDFDNLIVKYPFEKIETIGANKHRRHGKESMYQLGSIFVYKEFLITAFAKFDDDNKASLTMPEYLEFLINFWDKVNKVYGQKNVSVPIFGSGITRIKGHKNISDEDLLKIMLWTFRISEMRFKHPAKLTILIHKDKIDKINLLDIKSARNGL